MICQFSFKNFKSFKDSYAAASVVKSRAGDIAISDIAPSSAKHNAVAEAYPFFCFFFAETDIDENFVPFGIFFVDVFKMGRNVADDSSIFPIFSENTDLCSVNSSAVDSAAGICSEESVILDVDYKKSDLVKVRVEHNVASVFFGSNFADYASEVIDICFSVFGKKFDRGFCRKFFVAGVSVDGRKF